MTESDRETLIRSSIALSRDELRQLDEEATMTGMSRNAIIRRAIDRYFYTRDLVEAGRAARRKKPLTPAKVAAAPEEE